MTNARKNLPARAIWRRILPLLFCGWLAAPGALRAANSNPQQEQAALSAARALFDDFQYSLAETALSRFLAAYTNSPNRPFAILYLARSRLEQSNYDGAIQLLTSASARAGDLAAEYAFWTATARLDKGDFPRAAEAFAALIKNFPNSDRGLEAACNEAEAWSKMGDWQRTADLLQAPDGAFAKQAGTAGRNPLVARGRLLLGEALLALKKYAEGEKVAAGLDVSGLGPDWVWSRQYLLCRLQLAGGQAATAWQNASNLLDNASGPRRQAASWFLRGRVLESLGRTNEAIESYTNGLADSFPADDQRQALARSIELIVAQNQVPDAIKLLAAYVAVHTNGAALDLAHLSLGELNLKIFYTPLLAEKTNDLAAMPTNYLRDALSNLDQLITNFPGSPLLPRARLDRGWCHWAEGSMTAARGDFQAAADALDDSPDQAVARFKLADSELFLRDYPAALSNYNRLLAQYAGVESVSNGLFDQALYQIVETSLAEGDKESAQAALKKILDWYPNSLFGDRGQLLIGESKRYDYAMARRDFSDLLHRSPNTALLPEVEYAIARTYEQEGNWPEALRQYDRWVLRHASNAPALLPRVEYARALVYGKAGMESNALTLFTNFVARFPGNSLAPWAQNWVADFYFNQGDYQSAEKNYELLYQTFPNAGDLPWQARLMAGRAALAGQRAAEAAQYFTDLVAMSNAPAPLAAQGWFALGDAMLQQWQGSPTNLAFLNQAISAVSRLTNGVPTNAVAIQAYGRLGDYYMQWADLQWDSKHDSKVYADAVQMYQTILGFPAADVDTATLSQAEVALGRVAERQEEPGPALAHYCKVLYEISPAQFDPFWVEQAGKAAAQIYERQRQWDTAIKVYERVLKAVPSLRGALEKAIKADQIEVVRAKG